MNKIELTIVVGNYNTKNITLELLSSIQKYQPKSSYEIIVVDDCSNDESVKEFKKLKNIKLLVNKKNLGYVRTNNRGIKEAKGDYVLLLNSDVKVMKNSIQNLIDFAKSHNDAGVVGGQLLNLDGTVQPSCYNFPSIKNTILGNDEKFNPNNAKCVDGVVGAVFLITPKALEKVGMLNEKYISYYEDIDYCERTWRNALKVYYYPEAKFIHHHGATFKKLDNSPDQWRKLIPSSKLYNGIIKHYIIFLIMWFKQKCKKFLKK